MENKSKKLEFWEQPEQLSLLRFYARRFNNLKDVAEKMGIDRSTLWRWQKDSPSIRETLINNRWIRIAEIEDLLYEKAKEGKLWAINRYLKAFGGKNHCAAQTFRPDDCGIGLIAEVLSESPPAEEKPSPEKSRSKLTLQSGGLPDEAIRNIPEGTRKIIYKYTNY